MDVLTYQANRGRAAWRAFWHDHKLTLNHGRIIKRYHIIVLAMVCFAIALFIVGDRFTWGLIIGRFFDACGDLALDRGAGEL